MSKELHAMAKDVAIPTVAVESLNAAVAASVLLMKRAGSGCASGE